MLRHTYEGLCWTGFRDAAGVAVLAAIMPDLQVEGAVAKIGAAFHAESATGAQRLRDGVFEIGGFNEFTLDRSCRADLVFCSFIEAGGIWLEITKAELAIAAHHITMRTFHSGGLKHAFGLTLAALDALARIKLPDFAAAVIDS